VGKAGKQHHAEEIKMEFIYPLPLQDGIIRAMHASHPYEEVAYDIYPINNVLPAVGSGMIGELKKEISPPVFLKKLKQLMKTECIRHTGYGKNQLKKVAVCGGSGSFLLDAAISKGADILVTADFKYHQFFDADGKIIIADIGHYESEQFTKEHLVGFIKKKFPKFAVRLSEINTNPIKYL
jgi:putative NIF3 family GTP cyclohydrolase 1 type 2